MDSLAGSILISIVKSPLPVINDGACGNSGEVFYPGILLVLELGKIGSLFTI